MQCPDEFRYSSLPHTAAARVGSGCGSVSPVGSTGSYVGVTGCSSTVGTDSVVGTVEGNEYEGALLGGDTEDGGIEEGPNGVVVVAVPHPAEIPSTRKTIAASSRPRTKSVRLSASISTMPSLPDAALWYRVIEKNRKCVTRWSDVS